MAAVPEDISTSPAVVARSDWTVDQVLAVIERPFHDLLADAHACHRSRFDPHEVEGAKLLSIKTGACPEDCAYCPQSARNETELTPQPLMELPAIVAAAEQAKAEGASRFCMGAAWRSPNDRQVAEVAESVQAVADLGLETCVTLGMLTTGQAQTLADAGLDFYNHNLDTSPDFYGEIITTRTYDDRLETLAACREAGLRLCTGGIVGMGESRRQRAGLLQQLASLDPHPESVPINLLIQVPGTPLHGLPAFEPLELVRTIAATRLVLPESVVRLSAGRSSMSDELHALCLHAGASSIFLGDRLLTADNNGEDADAVILDQLDTTIRPRDTAVSLDAPVAFEVEVR
ncbi:MAG: biotin synthase BioB [Actinomycetota bacterium]